jgi:C4-dicarboxylate-binding protein DctP
MMPRKIAVAALSLAVLASLATGAAAQKTFTMKLSTPSLNDVNHEFMKAFKAGVEARAGGRIKVELYPASQLGQLPRTIEGVQLGTIEMEFPAIGFLVGLDPRFIVFDAPGIFDNVVHGHQVFNDPEIRKRTSTFGAAKGVEPLFMALNGPLMLLSHKPMRAVADLKGQKIRVPGGAPMHIEPFRRLGVSPITMPLGDVLPAMQNRALDGMTSGFNIMNSFKYYDIAKPVTELPGSFLVGCALINRAFFKSLGPELEAMVREEAAKHEKLYWTWGVQDLGRIRANWEKNGGQVIFFPEAEKKRYIAEATSALPALLAGNPQMKEDYDALMAAAKKYRK